MHNCSATCIIHVYSLFDNTMRWRKQLHEYHQQSHHKVASHSHPMRMTSQGFLTVRFWESQNDTLRRQSEHLNVTVTVNVTFVIRHSHVSGSQVVGMSCLCVWAMKASSSSRKFEGTKPCVLLSTPCGEGARGETGRGRVSSAGWWVNLHLQYC